MSPAQPESVTTSALAQTSAAPCNAMEVATRFGLLPVAQHQIWTVPSPLPGFETLQRFVLIGLQTEQPFLWLQSLDDAGVSFLLAPAAHFGLRYAQIDAQSLPMVMVLLPTQSGQPLRAHGQAPLVFDAQMGQFEQHIVEASEVEGDGVFAHQTEVLAPPGLMSRLLALNPQ